MLPQEFITLIVQGVATEWLRSQQAVAAAQRSEPPKSVEVERHNPDGTRRKEMTTLPQQLAELNDRLRVSNSLQRESNEILRNLGGKKKRKTKDDDDEEFEG